MHGCCFVTHYSAVPSSKLCTYKEREKHALYSKEKNNASICDICSLWFFFFFALSEVDDWTILYCFHFFYLIAILSAYIQEHIKGVGYVAKSCIVWRNSNSKCGCEISAFVHWSHVVSVADWIKVFRWWLSDWVLQGSSMTAARPSKL